MSQTSFQTLLVNRADPSDVTVATLPSKVLAADSIRVEIGPFALTANNVTYMVTGDLIGYWKYFAPEAYGFEADERGRMPVWGYGVVTQSTCSEVRVSTKIYGFFPVASSIDLKPVKLNPFGFQDGTDHRVPLHSIYNNYSLVDADPSFATHQDIQPVLRPLFTTSFLLEDFFASEDFFGAEQIILLSASSKTALGTAFCLSEGKSVSVTGLTSSKNKDFVTSTGFYNTVAGYDEISTLDPNVKTAIIDMAGNGAVMADIYDHFKDKIVYNCMVGKSHWQGDRPTKPTAGAPAVMFFAPDRAKKRFSDWGAQGFAEKLAGRWLPFCESANTWLSVQTHEGIEALLPVYKDLLNGDVSPEQSHLFKV